MYDIIIIGGGPAGLTAALYSLRAGKKVLIIEEGAFGGQITLSPKIENYPGHKSMSGSELADLMVDQVLSQGADVEIDKVTGIIDGEFKTVVGESSEYTGKAVIIAVGVKHRMLGLEREEEFVGNGISFCAVCDGAFYAGKDILVIGGGNSALQEAVLLSETCKSVTIVQDMPYLTGEKKLADLILSKENVSVIYNAKVLRILDGDEFRGIEISSEDGAREINADGMFVAIGLVPQNDSFKDLADLTEYGYFDSDESCVTKTKGIFAAGDCRRKNIRQVTTAAADGAVAALAACRYTDE